MINGMKPLIIFTKRFILDISQGSKYEIFLRFCLIFTILLSQNPPKKSPQAFEKRVASDKLTFAV